MDYHAALVYPSNFSQAAEKFDNLVWGYLEVAAGLSIPAQTSGQPNEFALDLPINSLHSFSFQQHLARLPISKGALGICSLSLISGPAFFGGIKLALLSFTGELGIATALEPVIGRPDNPGIQ